MLIGRNHEWRVLVDGNSVGSIAVRQSVELSVSPGHHTVRVVQSPRRLSPERSFDVADGGTADFWCRGRMVWPMYLAALVKPDLSIALKAE